MVERDEVIRVAREKLGVASHGATGEYRILARTLEPGEEIRAMVIARPDGRSWLAGVIVVATHRRLLVVAKRLLTRREVIDEVDLGRVRGGRLESPTRFVLDVQGAEWRFSFATPPAQVAELLVWARGERGPARFEELKEIARRKLGRVIAAGSELDLLVLGSELGDDEAVLDLACCTKPSVILAVCPARAILVPQQGLRGGDPPVVIAYDRLTGVHAEDGDLILEAADERHHLRLLLPAGAAEIVAGRISARLDAAPSAG